MRRLIDADALYEQIAKKEELARQRVLDTPSRMPNGDFNPSAVRYATQLDERTQMKFMIADAPTIDAVPVEDIKLMLDYCKKEYAFAKKTNPTKAICTWWSGIVILTGLTEHKEKQHIFEMLRKMKHHDQETTIHTE